MSEPFSFNDWKSGVAPPEGWDCADAICDLWDKSALDAFMRATVRPWSPPGGAGPASTPPPEPEPPKPRPAPPAGPAPVREARTTRQEKPESATVTHIQTRKTVAADDGWMMGLVFGEENKLKPSITKNWGLFLEHHPETCGVFAWDAFKLRTMLIRCPPWAPKGAAWTPRPVQDRDYSEAVMWLETRMMTPKASNIAAVVQTIAERASFDRLREYLGGLQWDGQKRLETWMTYYLGVEDGSYSRAVGKRWLISSVARGLEPGCKVDTMPILEGPQGLKKSTALRVLYGDEFFADELSDIGSKDAMMEMQGVWGLEIQEMHRFSAAETNAVKKFLTRQTDRFRPPYGRSVIEAPRRVVLAGTINPEGNAYLRDPTGARRFWPLECGRKLDIDSLEKDRDQLWAEAMHLYHAKTAWWVQDDELVHVEAEQEKRTDIDVWADVISPFLKNKDAVAQTDVLYHLGIPTKDADIRHAARIGRIMKKLGWSRHRERTNGEDRTMFRSPEHVAVQMEAEW